MLWWLARGLESGRPERREDAIRRLARSRSAAAAARLIEALEIERDYLTHATIVRALESMGASAVEPVAEALSSADPMLPEVAAEILARIGDARAIEPLQRAVGSGRHGLAAAARRARQRIETRLARRAASGQGTPCEPESLSATWADGGQA